MPGKVGLRPASVARRGWWNDADGWSLADFVVALVMPVWMFVAVKLALCPDLSSAQVDYFLVLSYPLLIAVGGKAIGALPLPWSGKRLTTTTEVVETDGTTDNRDQSGI